MSNVGASTKTLKFKEFIEEAQMVHMILGAIVAVEILVTGIAWGLAFMIQGGYNPFS